LAGVGGDFTIAAGNGGATNSVGGLVSITSGDGGGTAAGGAATLTAGTGGASAGAGGGVTISAGDGGGGAAAGGDVTINAGDATGGGSDGDIILNLGTGSAGGTLQVNTDFPSTMALFFNDGDNTNREGINIQCGEDSPSGTNIFVRFTDGNGSDGGGISRVAAATAAFFAPSDENLKTDIAPTKLETLEIINRLELKEFRRSHVMRQVDGRIKRCELTDQSLTPIGFIAQQAERVFPTMVNNDAKYGTLNISDTLLIPVLVGAIQQLTKRLEALEAV
jgi:hypothetical protein